jgi:hypothetical protein
MDALPLWVILILCLSALYFLLKPRKDPTEDHSALSQHAKDQIAEKDRRSRRELLADGVSYIESTRPGPGVSCPFVLYTGRSASGLCMPSRQAAYDHWNDELVKEQIRKQNERLYRDAIREASKIRVKVQDETPYQPSLLPSIGPEELRMMKRLADSEREIPQLPEGLPQIRILGGPREKTLMEKMNEGQDYIEAQFRDLDDAKLLPPGK